MVNIFHYPNTKTLKGKFFRHLKCVRKIRIEQPKLQHDVRIHNRFRQFVSGNPYLLVYL